MLLNFKHDLHMLQQNSYRRERYCRYVMRSGDYASAWRLVDVALLFMLCSTLLQANVAAVLIAVVLIVKSVMELRKKHKKPLVFTPRVRRLYSVTALLSLAAYVSVILFGAEVVPYGQTEPVRSPLLPMVTLLLISVFSWIVVLLAREILVPVEALINRYYRNDAIAKLQSMKGIKVVGITGSFGKTSTKQYLHRILSEKYDVLTTPGSFNTPMGVIRTIREMGKPYHNVFICEMGAKQRGDIKEICDMVHPEIGIITAVGEMHLETFGSIQNVQCTKFELADALPADGMAVVNNDFEMCRSRGVDNVACVRYSVDPSDNAALYHSKDIKYTAKGTDFTITGPDGFELSLHTPLVGECNISNLMAAVIVALKLEVPAPRIAYAVSRLEQPEHRLNMKVTPGGVTIIDDAFNSNPTGSKMAVDVLTHFDGGRRIIVTPGMIELGEKQFELNKELGRYAATRVDDAVIVGQYNREAIVSGLQAGGMADEHIHIVDSLTEAQKVLAGMMQRGNAILYENDLPDSFK